VTDEGNSDPATGNGAIMKTAPDAPTDLATDLSADTQTVMSFTWEHIGTQYGLDAISYKVYIQNDGGSYTELTEIADKN
jgi:hypothetical protein